MIITGGQGAVNSIQTTQAFAITPSDTLDLQKPSRTPDEDTGWLVYNNSEDTNTVKVDTYYGDSITYIVGAGQVVGVSLLIKRVYSTGTTINSGNLIAQK